MGMNLNGLVFNGHALTFARPRKYTGPPDTAASTWPVLMAGLVSSGEVQLQPGQEAALGLPAGCATEGGGATGSGGSVGTDTASAASAAAGDQALKWVLEQQQQQSVAAAGVVAEVAVPQASEGQEQKKRELTTEELEAMMDGEAG